MGISAQVIHNTEVDNWIARVISAGGTVSIPLKRAVNTLINDLKRCGAWQNSIIEMGISAGGNLTAALEKIKYPGGAVSALSTSGSGLSYTDALGITSSGSGSSFLSTINPITYGATSTTIACGVFITNEQVTNTFLINRILTNYESGVTAPTIQTGTSFGLNPNFSGSITYRIGYQGANCDQANTGVNFTQYSLSFPVSNGGATSGNFNVPVTFFKSSESAVDTYSAGSFSTYWIGKNVNQTLACKIAQAIRKFERLIGRDTNAKDLLSDGDSITVSVLSTVPATAWATKLSSYLGLRNGFHGVPGLTSSSGYANISQVSYEYPQKYVWLFGANDINNDPLKSTSGTSATITTYASNITNTVNYLTSKGIALSDIIICTPPYNTISSNTCQNNYADACIAACTSLGVTCIDVSRSVRNYDSSTIIGGDGLHYTDGGNELLYRIISSQTPILYADNFNRANGNITSNIPGTSIASYASTYSITVGQPVVTSNALMAGSLASNQGQMNWQLAAQNMHVRIVLGVSAGTMTLKLRMIDSSNLIYMDLRTCDVGNYVSAVATSMITGSGTSANGDVIEMYISGSSVTVFRNGTQVGGTGTINAALANGKGASIYLSGATCSIDDIIIYSNY